MKQHQATLEIKTRGRGFVEISGAVRAIVQAAGVQTGTVLVYCRHTSCSLLIQENADPTARHDLERWLEKMAPEDDLDYTHTAEGSDDMPSHLRAMMTGTSETVPVVGGVMALGRWQGLYLAEHRNQPHTRTLVVHVTGE
ncbi:MAG: secondary thiamine-phosphate synthase enzyme YjbQ [Planctomycetota bacterium]